LSESCGLSSKAGSGGPYDCVVDVSIGDTNMAMKKLAARYPGKCGKCRQDFPAGTSIMWGDGKTEHETCPAAVAAPQPLIGLVAGGTGVANRGQSKKTNKKASDCENCGEWLKVGEGELVYCVEDSGCMKHHDNSGWHVYCLDGDACKVRREEALVAQRAAKEAAKVKAAEEKAKQDAASEAYKAKRTELTAGMIAISCEPTDMATRGKVGAVIASNSDRSIRLSLVECSYDGNPIYREDFSAHDDWRTFWWMPKALAKEACLAYAAKVGITVDKARDWMSKYKGCAGEEVYVAVIEAAEASA